MPLNRTPRRGTPAGRSSMAPVGRSNMTPAGSGLRSTIQVQQNAIQWLSNQLLSLQAQPNPRQAQGPVKVQTSSVPEKCRHDVSKSAFRSWQRSMYSWVRLSRWSDRDAVLNIRLHCDERLQRAVDINYSQDEWEALSVQGAFNAIEKFIDKSSNEAVLWVKFFNLVQERGESVKDYIHRCQVAALDCEFKCTACSGNLTDYMLTHRVMAGVCNPQLKQELFQNYTLYNDWDKLIDKCITFEAAQNDAVCAAVGHDVMDPESGLIDRPRPMQDRPRPMQEVGAVCEGVDEVHLDDSGYVSHVKYNNKPPRPNSKDGDVRCTNCGRQHVSGRAACPARDIACHSCNLKGHFARCCRKTKSKSVSVVLSNVSCGKVGSKLPKMLIMLGCNVSNATCKVQAVADTGAEVSVAGPGHLNRLGIKKGQLVTSGINLNHVAGGVLRLLGVLKCTINIGGKLVCENIYFVSGVEMVYLSLHACKQLGLIHADFPNHMVSISAVAKKGEPVPQFSDKPATPPYAFVESNVPLLECWLKEHFSSTTFNVNRSPLPTMTGKPHHIHLMEGAVPHACHTPATVPVHWQAEVKKQLDDDVARGVIEPVPVGEPTNWCSRMVVVPKKSGHPRRTVDYQKLNKWCKRETHHTQAPFEMVSSVPSHTFKTTVDAYWGFHQVKLDAPSRELTTFITPWGRYRYCRTPMGLCSSPDAYTKRYDDAIASIERKFKCVDDVLLYDNSVEGAFWHVYELLQKCSNSGITLQPDKFKFCQREVSFVGYQLSWGDFKPAEERLAAIKNFPMPDQPTLTHIRAWYGLVNQIAPFLATAPIMLPFRELLKKPVGSSKVYWDQQLKVKFEESKDLICKMMCDGLVYYDQSRPTVAITDWSKEGVGFVILQQYCNCISVDIPFCCKGGWKLALCGSRHLTVAEAGYAPVEGEALAVAWCLKKARLFLLGCPNLVVVTDHRPLVKLLGDRALHDIANPRLLRLKEKTLLYKFHIKFLAGKRNAAADALSRYPALKAPPDQDDNEEDDEIASVMIAATIAVLEDNVGIVIDQNLVRQAAVADENYQLLINRVRSGDWPSGRSLELPCLKAFYNVRDRLSVVDGLVMYVFDAGHVRLVIPTELRHRVAANLHAGHQGLDSMMRRARQAVYWPGLDGDLQFHRSSCATCERHAPTQVQEPLQPTVPPDYPFQQVVADICQLEGKFYLVYADRLTGWVEIAHLRNGTTTAELIPNLRNYFSRWGAPEEISTDGGMNLASSEMRNFFKAWAVEVRLSSAHYPQSNGRAEAAVYSAKRILRDNVRGDGSLKTDAVAKALLQYHNTPLRSIDRSPAQLATGRQLRDSVPMAKQYYRIDQEWKKSLRKRELLMAAESEENKREYDKHAHPLRPLFAGQSVRIQDPATKLWDRSGRVLECKEHRQYVIKMDGSGRMTLRNRRHLRSCDIRHPTTQLRAEADTPPSQPPPTQGSQLSQGQYAMNELQGNRRSMRTKARPTWLNDFVQ